MITACSSALADKGYDKVQPPEDETEQPQTKRSGVFLNKKMINHWNCLLKVMLDFLPFTISEQGLVFLIKDMV